MADGDGLTLTMTPTSESISLSKPSAKATSPKVKGDIVEHHSTFSFSQACQTPADWSRCRN